MRLSRRGALTGFTLLVVALPLLAGPVAAHAQLLGIRRYTHADGLPQIQIYAVHQDSQGYIWVGSNAGLSRYDGRAFRSITAADGLASNMISKIDELPTGELVVAAGNQSVCTVRPNPLEIRCTRIHALDRGGGQVEDLHVDPDGEIWVGTETGLSHLRDGLLLGEEGVEDGLPSATVYAVTRDGEGTLWAGTGAGLARRGPSGWETAWPESGEPTSVKALSAGPSGLLVGAASGLFRRGEGGFRRIPLDGVEAPVRNLAQTPDGEIWAEASGAFFRWKDGVVDRYDETNGLPRGEIWSILVDRERTVWIGSGSGLWKFPQGPFLFYTESDGLPNPFVRALTSGSDGSVYLGTRNGVGVWKGGRISEVPIQAFAPDPQVWSLAPVPDGGLLIGTRTGLLRIDAAGRGSLVPGMEILPYPTVFSLLPWKDRSVLVGTGRGLTLWRDEGIHPPPPPLDRIPTASIISMARDTRNRIWMGLNQGGVVIADGGSLRSLGAEDDLSDQTVWSLASDHRGGMWIGTNGDGAFHVTEEGIQRFTSDDGLGNDFVWQVLVDSRGATWFFTGMGINRLSDGRMIHYGVDQGLLDLERAATAILEDSTGHIWFGTGTGVYRYDPARDRGPPPPPPVFLDAVQIGGVPFPENEYVFPHGTRTVSFRFSAPSYRDEELVEFRYRLAGVSEDWSEPSTDPAARFVGLGPGDYVLEVVAMSAWGRQNPEPLIVPFTVKAAFWETWWFRLGVVMVLLLGLSQIPALRARHHEAERIRLEGLVAERTREIRENARRLEEEIQERKEAERVREQLESQLRQAQKMEAVGRLAGGIAHDFNNLLTTVLGYTELLAADARPDSELGKDLEEIKRVAQRGAALVSQLLAFSRKQVVQWQALDLCGILQDMAGMITRVLGPRIALELDLPEAPLVIRGDQNQLTQVVMNLAVNARDAMPDGGRLLVAATPCRVEEPRTSPVSDTVPIGRYVRVVVSDSGEGMDEGTIRRAFEPFFTTKDVGKGSGLGLASVYGIIHQHKGFIQVSAAPGEGAQFEIYLPAFEEG